MKSNKSDNELLEEISKKLTELTAIIGLGGRDIEGQVKYLINFGLSISDISRLTGVPEGTIGRRRAEIVKVKSPKASK